MMMIHQSARRSTFSGSRAAQATSAAPWAFDHPCYCRRQWKLEASNRYCQNMARSHYENFPVMLSLFSKEQQEALAAIYAFARTADDFADELCFEGMRERLLDEWENQLWQCQSGRVTHPVFIALGSAMRDFELPLEPFQDLLDAFRQDCRKRRYETYDELLDYCRRSADPVGRLVLKVLGIDRPQFVEWSDRICTALQLTNHWQDISVDLRKDRIYLPMEDLERFRINEWSLFSNSVPRTFGALVVFEANRTRELFREGWPLVLQAGYPGGLYFAAVWLGGRAVLRMVKRSREAVLQHRPKLNFHTFTRTLVEAGIYRLPFGAQ